MLKTNASIAVLSLIVLSMYTTYLSNKKDLSNKEIVTKAMNLEVKVTETWLIGKKFPFASEKKQKTKDKNTALVNVIPERMYTDKEIDCMARNIYFESRGEDKIGQYAVATVTANRMRSKYWGEDICSVVYAPKQYSWTINKKNIKMKLNNKAWEQSKVVAVASLRDGVRVNGLEKALFYHATYVDPYWKDVDALITQVGTHVFYKNSKGANYSV